MSKYNKIVVFMICILILLSVIITGIVLYYRSHPIENKNIVTIETLNTLKDRSQKEEEISISEFKKYTIISSEEIEGFTYTYYEYNELYDLCTVSLGDKVYAVLIVNRMTGTYCDVLTDDVELFMQND